MPRKAGTSTPRSRSSSRTRKEVEPEQPAIEKSLTPEQVAPPPASTRSSRPPSARSTPGRITPSRVCKAKSKYANDLKVPTPVPEIASQSLLAANDSANDSVIDKILETASSLSGVAVAPFPAGSPEQPLIQDKSGFSDDEQGDSLGLGMRPDGAQDSTAIGVKNFNFSTGSQMSFQLPTNLADHMRTPATPIVSARVAEQLNQLKVDLAAAGELPENMKQPTDEEVPQDANAVERTPEAGKTQAAQEKQAEAKRPSYKNRLQAYCRKRLNFNKGTVDIKLTEDAGAELEAQPTALWFKKSNKIYVNIPFRQRLHSVAEHLGITTLTIALHCLVFLVSFWASNLLYTFHFPASEDERVNYFYELLTRQEVGSFLVHINHPQRWFIRPRFTPEVVAMFLTILASSAIASFTRRDSIDQKNTPKIKLLKIC